MISAFFGAFVVIGITWFRTRKSVKSLKVDTRVSVKPEENSNSICPAERAWLVIKIRPSDSNIDTSGLYLHFKFSVVFKNWGARPARIVRFDQHIDCRDRSAELPLPALYSNEERAPEQAAVVQPGELWRASDDSYLDVEKFFSTEEWAQIQSGRMGFVYWGRIQYWDSITDEKAARQLSADAPAEKGSLHESRFCYSWNPRVNEFLVCGPSEYNQQT